MDKRWRNLGIVLIIIVVILLLLNLNLFISGPSESEKMHSEFENIYVKNNVDGNNIKSLTFAIADDAGNITYVGEKASLLAVQNDVLNLKSQLDNKYSSEIAKEGKVKADVIVESIEFLFFEDELLGEMVEMQSQIGTTMCDNAQLIVDVNTLMAQRSGALWELSNLVDSYNLDYNNSEEVVVIDKGIEEMSELYFATTTQEFLDECGLGLLSPEQNQLVSDLEKAFVSLASFLELRGFDFDNVFYEPFIEFNEDGSYAYETEAFADLKEDLLLFVTDMEGGIDSESYARFVEVTNLISMKIDMYTSYEEILKDMGNMEELDCGDLNLIYGATLPSMENSIESYFNFEIANNVIASKYNMQYYPMNSAFEEYYSSVESFGLEIDNLISECGG